MTTTSSTYTLVNDHHFGDSGALYTGYMLNGKPEGVGTMRQPNGVLYSGHWIDGMPSGQACIIYPDGTLYQGMVFKGIAHGQGSVVWPNGIKYYGSWINNVPNGWGRKVFEQCSIVGEWDRMAPLINCTYQIYYHDGQIKFMNHQETVALDVSLTNQANKKG